MNRKKILLCSRYYLEKSKDHLSKKFESQITALNDLGYDVYYIGIIKNTIYLCHEGKEIMKIGRIDNIKIPLISNILQYHNLYKSLYVALDKVLGVDYLYVRMMFALGIALKSLKKAKRKNIKVIMEIPSYPSQDEHINIKGIKKIAIDYYDNRASLMGKYVDLYALIGETANELYGKPAINISNGIDLSNIPVRMVTEKEDNKIHILVLAAISYWHGYDRLFEGLKEYVSSGENHEIKPIIHVVGPSADGTLEKLKAFSEENGLEDYVVFHGPLYAADLDNIFNQCNVGCASLGIHRKKKTITSELKIREYMSRGIPFIYSAIDPSINENVQFAHKVKADESYINMKELIEFALKNSYSKEVAEEMRLYAENNMTWDANFLKIFDHLSQIEINMQNNKDN